MGYNGKLRVAAVLWLACVAGGSAALWGYVSAPGAPGTPVSRWPEDSRIRRHPNRPTLVVFLHPRCPCSTATVAELSQIVSRSRGRLAVRAAFFRPQGAAAGWERTALWSQAEEVVGAAPMADEDGREARRFGAETSGQAILYDAYGRLLFHGGLTPGRGHQGDNPGRRAVLERLLFGARGQAAAPVFGCSLWRSS